MNLWRTQRGWLHSTFFIERTLHPVRSLWRYICFPSRCFKPYLYTPHNFAKHCVADAIIYCWFFTHTGRLYGKWNVGHILDRTSCKHINRSSFLPRSTRFGSAENNLVWLMWRVPLGASNNSLRCSGQTANKHPFCGWSEKRAAKSVYQNLVRVFLLCIEGVVWSRLVQTGSYS